MFPLLLVEKLVLQFRLILIEEEWMFDDSMKTLHRICQIPMNCQYKSLLASVTALGTFADSSFVLHG